MSKPEHITQIVALDANGRQRLSVSKRSRQWHGCCDDCDPTVPLTITTKAESALAFLLDHQSTTHGTRS